MQKLTAQIAVQRDDEAKQEYLSSERTKSKRRFEMSDSKNVERIENEDGSELKVIGYDDHILVHEKDADGNTTGHTTDWFDNQVHVHDKDDDRWEGTAPSNDNSDDSTNDNNEDSSDNSSDNNGGGCFITSAVCANLKKADDCVELTMF